MILYKTASTADDFIRAEVEEHGWDYVEGKFALGYEPMAPNGFWVWMQPYRSNGSNTLGAQIGNNSQRHPSRVIVRN